MKDKISKEWVKKKKVPASETSCTVDDLKEGQQYEFRVRAVNKAGPSEPSDSTNPIIAKCRFVKPFIIGDELKPIIVKKGKSSYTFLGKAAALHRYFQSHDFWSSGQQIKYDIRYGGEPEPEVKWVLKKMGEKEDKEIKSDGDRITIERPERNTILTIRKGVRADTGKYKLILTNSSGTYESIGDVIVLDKPTPPKGLVPEKVRGKKIPQTAICIYMTVLFALIRHLFDLFRPLVITHAFSRLCRG